MQEAEFVAFWVGQNVPALGAALADVGGSGAESEQPLQFGVLVAVGGVDVDVQPEFPGPRVGTGAEDEGRLQAAEAGVRRPDLDASVVFPSEFDVAEDLAPERREPAGIGGVDDQLADAACHACQCRQATREPIAGHVEGGVLRDRALPGGTGSAQHSAPAKKEPHPLRDHLTLRRTSCTEMRLSLGGTACVITDRVLRPGGLVPRPPG